MDKGQNCQEMPEDAVLSKVTPGEHPTGSGYPRPPGRPEDTEQQMTKTNNGNHERLGQYTSNFTEHPTEPLDAALQGRGREPAGGPMCAVQG